MNILHISHTDINKDNRIIKEMLAVKSLDNLKVYGIGVELDESNISHSTSLDKSISTLQLKTKKLKLLPRFIRYFLNFLELVALSLLKLRKVRPQLIHCHDTLVLPIAWLYKLLKPSTILIYDAHELESQKNGQNKILSTFTLLIERIVWKKINGFITVSESIQQWYISNLGTKPSCIIYNAPVTNEEHLAKDKILRERFGISINEKIFLYVGYISTGRNIEKLLEIFEEQDDNFHLIFIGYGPLVDLVKKFENKLNNIHYHESVRHDKLVSILEEANAGLCLIPNSSLSDYYALPNKFFEYILAGLTVIASDFPDLRKKIDKYELGYYCNPHSKEEIVKVIEKFKEKEIVITDTHPLTWHNQTIKLQTFYNQMIK